MSDEPSEREVGGAAPSSRAVHCCCCGTTLHSDPVFEAMLPCGHGYCLICTGRGHEEDHDCSDIGYTSEGVRVHA